jgi:hypothetical protein
VLQLARHGQGELDVPFLRRFVAAEEQEIDGCSFADEIEPVSRAEVDPHFGHAFPDWLAIAEVSEAGLIQPRENARSRFLIGDAAEPGFEPWRSSKDKHAGL